MGANKVSRPEHEDGIGGKKLKYNNKKLRVNKTTSTIHTGETGIFRK